MDLKAKTDTLLKEQVELKAKLKEVFQNESLRKDTRWDYFKAYSSLKSNELHVGLPDGYLSIAREQGLEPWQDEFTPPGHYVQAVEIVAIWENAGLDTVKLKDFFMETGITEIIINE